MSARKVTRQERARRRLVLEVKRLFARALRAQSRLTGESVDALRRRHSLVETRPNEYGCIVDDDVCIAHSRPLVTKTRCEEGRKPKRRARS